MKIQEIKAAYQALDPDDEPMLQQFIHTYGTDARSGVQTLVEQTKKKLVQLEAEYVRSEKMLAFERKYHAMGSRYICGIDEVGRGPLAGPVVACAVILPEDEMLLHLNDSKQVPRKKREILYDIIREKAVAYGIGVVSEKRIDEINILQATYEAMRMAIANLKVQPDLLLNDAVRIPEVDIKQVPIIKGDTLSASIAAASIVAKVTRDRMMVEYDKVYPGYDFASNMGYGSAKHYAGLDKLGPCEIHRRAYIKEYV
jgi:ribonuclease HII